MKQCLITGLFLLISFLGFPQGEFNNWYFGHYCGMNFNSGAPVFLSGNPMHIGASLAEASVSDSSGTHLFFSNGLKIYNRNKVIMPNGSGLLGGEVDCQVMAVQEVTNHDLYYLFTVHHRPFQGSGDTLVGSYFSVIDMQLDGGLGDIVTGMKNIRLTMGDSVYTQLTATRHQNNRDAWVVVLEHGKVIQYLAFLINSSGLNLTPVVSPSTLKNSVWNSGSGGISSFMRISQNGEYLLCTDSLTEMCLFNTLTGVVTPKFRFWAGTGNKPAESQEFSIDSRYVYFTTSTLTPWRAVVQYDMMNPDSNSFMDSRKVVGDSCGYSIQMAPDGKIYVSGMNAYDSLQRINNPSAPGAACNYQKNAFGLEGNPHFYCLPQFLQRYKAYIHSNGHCQYDPFYFASDIWPPADSIHWDFGDPSSGVSNYSNLGSPSHLFSGPGNFTVEMWVRHIDKRTDTSWIVVNVLPSPHPVLGEDITVCTGDSATFDAGSCTTCTYLWRNLLTGLPVGSNQTFTATITGMYEVAVSDANDCTGRDTVQFTVTPIPVVTNTSLLKTICSWESTNIVLTSNVSNVNFHWIATLTSGNITGFSADSGLVINQILVNHNPSPGAVTYHITPKAGSCIGTPSDYEVTVNPGDSVKVAIAVSQNPVCAGTGVTFTASPTNGGTSPVYQWYKGSTPVGTNSDTYSYIPVNGDVITVVMTASPAPCQTGSPVTSNAITMMVNPLLSAGVTISAGANPVCAGTIVKFTATPTNGGTAPVYQWYKGSIPVGTNSDTYFYIPVNGDVITVVMTSTPAPCLTGSPATSNAITMTVNPVLSASVTIAANANPVCAGTSVTYTATPVNEGTTPAYQWYKGSTPVGSNSTIYSYIPADGDVISVVMTSSASPCLAGSPATSNAVTMTVNPILPASVTIAADANPVCAGTSVKFTATPVNGGTTPVYQWYKGLTPVGSNSDTYSYIPVNGDVITVVMTSTPAPCLTGSPATSNAISMTVNTLLPASLTITASANPVCAGISVTFTATPVNGGTTPIYQWKVNGGNVGGNSPIYSYIPQTGDSIRCIMTSNLACVSNNPASSNKIVMTASSVPVVTFNYCFDSITTVNAKPIKLKGGIPLGGTYSGPGVNLITSVFTPSVAGIGAKTITYSYTNFALCSASKTKTIIVQSAPAFTCGNSMTDIRDNKVYPTLQLGSQCWMASNLNYGTMILASSHQRDNCTPEKYCYNDLAANCQLGTAAYQWDELMRYDDTPGLQGFCPPGWHVPTETDWNTLFSIWTNNGFAGAPLKYSGYSGFNALMSGVRHMNVQWDYQNLATFFWSSTPYGAYKAWAHGINDYDPSVAAYPSSRSNAFSIRCLRD
jgi:uncharacterized protein (TIGR02145 family)